MKFLAIIPARGGSKGIKNKNLRKVGNESLLERAIKSVNDLMDTIVSTDNVKIKGEAFINNLYQDLVRLKTWN